MKRLLIALAACSTPPSPPVVPPSTPPAAPSVSAPTVPPATAAALTCETATDWRPSTSYKQSDIAVHLRVVAASPGPTTDQHRCVALDLEVVAAFHGRPNAGDRVKVVVRQSMIERYTSRPAGPWWIVEQSLAPGTEYVALCHRHHDSLADALPGGCTILPAAPHLADLALVRETELANLEGKALIERLRASCATANVIATGWVWEQTGVQALKDLAIYDAQIAVLLEPTCSPTARAVMFDVIYGVGLEDEALPHVRRLVRAMFALLAMPEASALHENVISTYLPNALGLEGGMKKRTPADIFAGDAKGRAVAVKTLSGYQGPAGTAKLRAWLK